jgi:hypothetical protein
MALLSPDKPVALGALAKWFERQGSIVSRNAQHDLSLKGTERFYCGIGMLRVARMLLSLDAEQRRLLDGPF